MRKKRYSYLLLFILQITVWKILSNNQNFADWWFNTINYNFNYNVSRITSKINFPVGEILYCFVLGIVVFICYDFFKKRGLNDFLFKLFLILNIFLFIYQSLWGMVYYKKSFTENSVKVLIKEEYVKNMYFNYIKKLEIERSLVTSDESKPIDFIYNHEYYLNDFKAKQNLLLNDEWINNYFILNNPSIKISNFSTLQNYIGILGYYNPFTVESNVNRFNTDIKSPFTIAHELAHQMGFSSENEANFIAYYLGIHSDIPEVRYSAYFKTTFSLLFSLLESDPEFVKNELNNLPEGIKIDRKYEIEYYAQYEGNSNKVFSLLNDQFLKSNNQDGIVSYSKYVELVYFYEYYIKKGSNFN